MPHKFVLRDAGGRDNPVGEATTIGRDAACQILLTGDPLVSRRHALLWAQDDVVYVRDENSSNGTFVNGQRLAPNQALRLQMGDKLGVGSTLFLLVAAEKPPATVIPGQPALAAGAALGAPAPAPATVSAPAPAPAPAANAAPAAPRRRAIWLACAVVGVLAALVVCGAGAVILYARGPALLAGVGGAPTPGPAALGTVTPAATGGSTPAAGLGTPVQILDPAAAPQPLLSAQQYAASNQDLARAVAALNQAELDFVRAATGAGLGARAVLARPARRPLAAGDLDALLRNVAANAFNTATIADRLSQTAAAQAGGSAAASQTGAQYRSVARIAAALVIEAQNARSGLADGSLPAKTVAGTVAEYGARLWNPAAVNLTGDNPFTPLLPAAAQLPTAQDLSSDTVNQLASKLGGNLTAWVATSGETVTKTLTLPPVTGPVTIKNDAATTANLATADGQKDGDAARALAATIIKVGSDIPADKELSVETVVTAFWSDASVADPKASPAKLPAYPKGSASAVTTGATPDDTLSTLIQIGSGGEVTPGEQTQIKDTKPLVNLTLSNLVITAVNKRPKDGNSTFEADMTYEFDVQWTANLASPRFALECVSNNYFEITSASGKQHIRANGLLILYPGAEDAYCYASSNGNTWGSTDVRFLVGDSDGATQRAVQVETDSASLDLTQTADAASTAQAATANAAGTQQAATSNAAASQAVLGTQNALETEVAAQQTQEFAATITAIARLTALAVPTLTEIPSPTATFAPVFVEQLFHAGNVFAVSTTHALQPGRLYRFCFSGQVNLINPDRSVLANQLDHVNGIAVPVSGCLVVEGDGKVATVSCGEGEPAADPGGFTIQVFDLGPT